MFGQGNDVAAHRCQQIVNIKIDVTTHGTGSWLSRPNMGGVMVSTPPCQEEGQTGVCLLDVEYSHPYEEGPSLLVEGWLHTLVMWNESTTTTKTGINKYQNYPTARA